jgi:MFS family permease
MTNVDNAPAAPNAKRLLIAGFMAILAAGVGFAIRGGIFDNWGAEYGFTAAQLGAIGGAGFSGFCFGIIIGGVVCDKIGYGKLVILAFALHVLSAFVTFTAKGDGAYASLYWGMFIFAYANGTLEAVANPLVATLFPNNRTHYLNILHASWPAGLIIGGVLGWILDDKLKLSWQVQLSLYLIPTLAYGLMFLGQHMPKSEASKRGLTLGEMFKDVGVLGGFVVCYLLTIFFQNALQLNSDTSYVIGAVLLVGLGIISRQMQKPSLESFAGLAVCAIIAIYFQNAFRLSSGAGLAIGCALALGLGLIMRWPLGSFLLFVLFVTHALVGAVELGTDGWIQNITGNILSSEQGKILFVFTSATMFALRFCANFIEKKVGLSPVGILLVCAILACVGLNMVSTITSFGMALLALTIYGIGKTFFWPTMLAVTSDRFPRTGAIAISIMGGIGMMSAGLIGSPGLGYAKDRFAGESLKTTAPTVFEDYKADKPSEFLFFAPAIGLDGKKLGGVQGTLAQGRSLLEKGGEEKVARELEGKAAKLQKRQAELDAKRQQIEAAQKQIQDKIESQSKSGKKEWDHEVQEALDEKAKLADQGKQLAATLEKHAAEGRALTEEKAAVETMKVKLRDAGVLKAGEAGNLNAAQAALTEKERAVHRASIVGDRRTLRADSFIPATMACIYLLLLVYFKTIGGYKPVHIVEEAKPRV